MEGFGNVRGRCGAGGSGWHIVEQGYCVAVSFLGSLSLCITLCGLLSECSVLVCVCVIFVGVLCGVCDFRMKVLCDGICMKVLCGDLSGETCVSGVVDGM